MQITLNYGYNSANYGISGFVYRLGVKCSCEVFIYYRSSGSLVKIRTSDRNGYYAFHNLTNLSSGYFAIAFDKVTPLLNAAIADLITPELIS